MIGICLIGAGRAGMIHARNFLSRVPNARMTAVADAVEDNARRAAEELRIGYYTADYREALERKEVDAVVVVTPTKYHRDIAVAAANAGKHILCEKPMAMTEEECREMTEAAEKNHVKLQIGFMRRFDANFVRAKEMIGAGEIGQVVTVKSLTHGPSVPQEWMYDIRKSNGPLAEVNSHDIDTIRWFTGSEAVSLYAVAGNYRCRQAKEAYPDFYDTVLMNMRMENGCIAHVDGAQGVQYGYDARVEIVGTKGSIQIGGLQQGTTLLYTKEGLRGDVVNSWRTLFSEAYFQEDVSFVDCILNDTAPKVTGWDGRKAVEIVRAGNESIRTGNVVQIRGGCR